MRGDAPFYFFFFIILHVCTELFLPLLYSCPSSLTEGFTLSIAVLDLLKDNDIHVVQYCTWLLLLIINEFTVLNSPSFYFVLRQEEQKGKK